MPKNRRLTRANKKRYRDIKRGTFKHRPTVKIPDPTAWGIPLRSNWLIRRG